MQSGVERAVFDLQDIPGPPLDGVGDGVPVGGAQYQRPEDSMSSVPWSISLSSGDSRLGIPSSILHSIIDW